MISLDGRALGGPSPPHKSSSPNPARSSRACQFPVGFLRREAMANRHGEPYPLRGITSTCHAISGEEDRGSMPQSLRHVISEPSVEQPLHSEQELGHHDTMALDLLRLQVRGALLTTSLMLTQLTQRTAHKATSHSSSVGHAMAVTCTLCSHASQTCVHTHHGTWELSWSDWSMQCSAWTCSAQR